MPRDDVAVTPFRSALPWALVPTVLVVVLLAVLDLVALFVASVGYGASAFFAPALGGGGAAAPSLAEHGWAFTVASVVAVVVAVAATALTMRVAARGDAPALRHPRLVGLLAGGVASLVATAVLTLWLGLSPAFLF